MLTAIKINKMRRLPATFKQQFTTKQLKSNSIINLYNYYLIPNKPNQFQLMSYRLMISLPLFDLKKLKG